MPVPAVLLTAFGCIAHVLVSASTLAWHQARAVGLVSFCGCRQRLLSWWRRCLIGAVSAALSRCVNQRTRD
ncbi:hypothetical protein BKA70DRAFT_1276815 [Coprinopsis sp. MPI-PUGE-AT-0042]|nr:hypothetical protein BKA70DRAFT_1276815 [Coprinopsis sp. MPI-PUGE-AT-0042]